MPVGAANLIDNAGLRIARPMRFLRSHILRRLQPAATPAGALLDRAVHFDAVFNALAAIFEDKKGAPASR